MAAEIVQQGAHIGGRLHEHDQQSIGIQHADDGEPGAEFEYAGVELTPQAGMTQLCQTVDRRREQGGYGFGIHAVPRPGVDGEPIAAHHDHGVDPGAPAKRFDHIPDRRHTAAKLGLAEGEVKL